MRQFFYVGTYCGRHEESLFLYELDSGAKTITKRGSAKGIQNPSYLALGESRGAESRLFTVSEGEQGGAALLRVTRDSDGKAEFQLLDEQPVGGSYPCHLLPVKGGVLASNYGSGNISVFLSDGDRLDCTQLISHSGSGQNPERQEGPHTHFCGNFGDFIYAADLGIDQLKCYTWEDGRLLPHAEKDIPLPGGTGVRHFAVSPLFPHLLFALCELSSEMLMVDPLRGEVLQRISTLPAEHPESSCAAIKVSRSGRWLFASNRGDDSIAVIRLSEEGMALTDVVKTMGKTPRDFAVIGDQLVVANQDSDNLCLFDFDEESGKLVFTGTEITCPKPVCVIEAM